MLLIDLDPQASLTLYFGINLLELPRSIHDVLILPEVSLRDIIRETPMLELFLAPSHLDLMMAELELAGRIGREKNLQKKLLPVREDFDFILIDCPPTLGILTINALVAADGVLIPVQPEPLVLYGMKHLLQVINMVQEEVNKDLKIEGVFITMLDRRRKLSQEVVENVKNIFGDLVFRTIISSRVNFSRGPLYKAPIFSYAPKDEGAMEYSNLARELLDRIEGGGKDEGEEERVRYGGVERSQATDLDS